MQSETTIRLILAAMVATSTMASANAATVGSGVMACPSIDAWEHVMEALNSRGGTVATAGRVGGREGCVSVPPGTSVEIAGTIGPFSRVPAPNGQTFYFRSDDLR